MCNEMNLQLLDPLDLEIQHLNPRGEKRHKKKIGYTEEKEDKGQTPLSGRMKGKEFAKILFQTLHVLKREIKEMKRERHEGPSRIYVHE